MTHESSGKGRTVQCLVGVGDVDTAQQEREGRRGEREKERRKRGGNIEEREGCQSKKEPGTERQRQGEGEERGHEKGKKKE